MKHFSGLTKKDKSLYQKVISLPFISRQKKFDEYIKELRKSALLSKKEKDYLNSLLERRQRWAKTMIKHSFGGGISTTSRIEGLHAVLKKYLNSKSSLQNIFYCFREIEDTQIEKFSKEFNFVKNTLDTREINFIKELEERYPKYVVKKLIQKYIKSLNYNFSIEKSKGNSKRWYLY